MLNIVLNKLKPNNKNQTTSTDVTAASLLLILKTT